MATKKQRYISPIGTFNYAWISKPCKWDDKKERKNGETGGSVVAGEKDLAAKYSIKVIIDPKSFEDSDFKKQIDDIWGLLQEDHKGKYDVTIPPYQQDDEGNYVLFPETKAAFQDKKSGDIRPMHPRLMDCEGKDITDFIKNEDIRVADSSVGRVYVTTYSGGPYKSSMGRNQGKKVLPMKLDLKVVQFKRLDRSENSGSGEPIEDGVPVAEDYGEAIPI